MRSLTNSKRKKRNANLSKDEISVLVRNNDGVLYDGKALSISSINDYGTFDILPRHANFICLIHEKLVIVISKDEKKEMDVDTGVLRVYDNIVDIFLGVTSIKLDTKG